MLAYDLPTSKQLPPAFRSAVMLAAGAAQFWDGHQQECADLLEQCLTGLQRWPAGALQAEALGTVALVESYWTRSQRAEVAARQAEALLDAERLEPPIPLQLAAALRCLIGADFAGLDRQLKGTIFRDLVGVEPALESAVALVAGLAAHRL